MKKGLYSNNALINFGEKSRRFFMFEDKASSRRKIFASVWAVFFGILAASIIYWIIGSTGTNPQKTTIFTFVQYIFQISTRESNKITFILYFLFFAFSGLAISIGFKSGLFNIGVSGQMTFPAIIFFTIVIALKLDINKISTEFLAGMFIVFIIMGMFIGLISGVLKAFFNVHEVISTIFLNWILTYVAKFLFTQGNQVFGKEAFSYFDPISGTQKLVITSNQQTTFIYFGIALLALLVFAIWFIYSKTAIGYKIKMVGLNKTNAKYVGVNEKLLTVTIMGISGALSGIAGFFLIILKNNRIEAGPAPMNIGFEAIAIALIALNSPIGVVFTSIIYSLINTSQIGFSFFRGSEKVTGDFFPIITGIIIFMSALAIIFYKFRVIRSIAKYLYLLFNKNYWYNLKVYHVSKWKYIIPERIKLFKLYFSNFKAHIAFRKTQKEYEDSIYKQIKSSKKMEQEELLSLYSKLSKEKFAHQEKRNKAGLNNYRDEKNKYKNQVKNRKQSFKLVKESLFLEFNKKVLEKYKRAFKIHEPAEGEI